MSLLGLLCITKDYNQWLKTRLEVQEQGDGGVVPSEAERLCHPSWIQWFAGNLCVPWPGDLPSSLGDVLPLTCVCVCLCF